ncbi:hypothetical protein BT69DRAFT_1353413 [Atractiella rhizophila]|nr:hypothetical protein BT69DRAFT_1353413 [Atractiella rhizophila]
MSSLNEIVNPSSLHPITKVTLHPNRAIITRSITAHLEEGENHLTITHLSSCIIDRSLRAKAKAFVETRIKHVDFVSNSLDSTKKKDEDPKVLELEKELQRSEEKRILTQWKIDTFRSYIQSANAEQVPIEKADELWRIQDRRAEELMNELREVNEKLENVKLQLEEEKERVDGQKDDLEEENMKTLTSKAKIEIWAVAETDIELEMTYAVTNASWTPAYDASLSIPGNKSDPEKSTQEEELKLTYQALLSQSTGEEWTNVSLTLSTAILSSSLFSFDNALPTLSRWTIGYHRPDPPSNTGQSLFGSPATVNTTHTAYTAYGIKGTTQPNAFSFGAQAVKNVPTNKQPKVEATELTAEFKGEGALSATFQVKGTISLRSSAVSQKGWSKRGVERRLVVTELSFPRTLEWICVPRSRRAVVLLAKARNTSAFPLMKGEVAVHLDGDFVGTSTLHNVNSGAEFSLNLGAAPSMLVTYPPLSKLLSTAGLISKTDMYSYTRTITLQYTKLVAPPTTVLVKDQIPISEDATLTVKLLTPSLSANWKELKPEKGVMSRLGEVEGEIEWKVTLKGGDTKELKLEWEVGADAGEKVRGLDSSFP